MLAFKLGSLLIKQITKPVSAELKRQANAPGSYARQVCKTYGEFHHRVESRLSLRLLGHNSKKIKLIPEEVAVATGAAVLSEAFVFSVAAGLLVFEIQRKAKQDEKAKAVKDEKEREKERQLEMRFARVEQQLQQLMASSIQTLQLSSNRQSSAPPATTALR